MAHIEHANANRTYFPLDIIHEHPKNPRKTFNLKALEELAQTFGDSPAGIRQDLLLRPHPTIAGEFEIVIGHRRGLAARLAGFEAVPARVENLTDVEVREIQLIENGQREDVHPLEEAETIEAMRVELGLSYAEIAAKLGKSESLIFRRLRLLALNEKSREAYRAGLLTEATAFLLARVPKALQDRACEAITTERAGWDPKKRVDLYEPVETPKPAREVGALLTKHFMLPLTPASKLPFDPKDGELLAGTPACGECEKRTGNARNLFGDIEGEDVCTDPTCYSEKTLATFRVRAAAVAEKGWEIIEDAEKAKEIFPYSDSLNRDMAEKYVDLREQCYAFDKPITFGDLLRKAEKTKKGTEPLRRVLVLSPWGGHAVELAPKKQFDAYVADSGLVKKTAKGITPAQKEDRRKDPERVRQQQEAAERKIRRRVVDLLATQGLATLLPGGASVATDALYRGAISAICVGNRLGAELGFIAAKKPIDRAALESGAWELDNQFQEVTLPKLKGDLLLAVLWYAILKSKDPFAIYPDSVTYAAKAIGDLDLAKVEKDVRAEATAKTEKAKQATADGTAKQSAKSAKKADRKAAAKKETAKRPPKKAAPAKKPAAKKKGK